MQTKTQDCVLVVEDHADTLRFLLRLLSMSGYTAHGAASVGEAMDVARREGCGLLVADLGLPDGSGIDLLRALRADADVKGIAVTGHGGDDVARDARAAGFAAHLVKPVTFDALLKALKAVEN
jgi:DNA-binding response OmpR family regulator